jgi:hypothetical protein
MKTHKGITFAFSGRGIKNDDLHALLIQSYEPKLKNHGDYRVDRQLSGQRVQVYHNKKTGETVIAHRGTADLTDVGTDIQAFFGVKSGARWKHAEKVQREAEAKYGTENLTTIGHSLGAQLASEYGNNSKEIITLNKPYSGRDEREHRIRTKNDPFASSAIDHQPGTTVIESESSNPWTEHSVDTLKRLPGDKYWGQGRIRRV